MTTPNAELIARLRQHTDLSYMAVGRPSFGDQVAKIIAEAADALAASDARVAELERVETALITIIRNVHGHLLNDRIDAARSAP